MPKPAAKSQARPGSKAQAEKTNAGQHAQHAPTNKPQTADDVAKNYALFDQLSAGKYPLLKKIGEAESGFKMQRNKQGSSSAYGIFQLLKIHDSRARAMGLSRFTPEGNILIAIAIYNEQGTTPWLTSKHRANGTGWGDY